MAATIHEQRIIDNHKRTLVKWVYISDGSQSANATLLDVSTLNYALNTNGQIMTGGVDRKAAYRVTIKRIMGSIHTKNKGKATLQWHGSANSPIAVASDSFIDFNFDAQGDGAVIPNPESNTNGNLLITTSDLTSGDAFTLFLDLRKDARDYDQGQSRDPAAFNAGPYSR